MSSQHEKITEVSFQMPETQHVTSLSLFSEVFQLPQQVAELQLLMQGVMPHIDQVTIMIKI